MKPITNNMCCRCGAGLGTGSMIMLNAKKTLNKFRKDLWCCKNCYDDWEKKYLPIVEKRTKGIFDSKIYLIIWTEVFFDNFLKIKPKVKVQFT